VAVTAYVREGCPFSAELLRRLDARGTRATVIDVAAQPERVPELLKLTRGRRVVPVLVDGARLEVAPDGGSEF
jgi:glutaredoxin